MGAYIHCPRCREEITSDSDFCPHCGVVFEEAGFVSCGLHADRAATALCIICRIPLCADCEVDVHGRKFCREHSGVEVQQDWATVVSLTDVVEADLVRAVLQEAGCRIQLQNFNNVAIAWDGGGDSAVSRSNIGRPAKVLVPIPEYLNAVQIVEEWRSSASGASE